LVLNFVLRDSQAEVPTQFKTTQAEACATKKNPPQGWKKFQPCGELPFILIL